MSEVVYSFVIKSNNPEIDFVSADGIHWLSENLFLMMLRLLGEKRI